MMEPKQDDNKKKAIAALIIGSKPPASGPSDAMSGSDEAEEGEADETKLMMAEEVMAAMQSGNAKEFAESLDAYVSHCMDRY